MMGILVLLAFVACRLIDAAGCKGKPCKMDKDECCKGYVCKTFDGLDVECREKGGMCQCYGSEFDGNNCKVLALMQQGVLSASMAQIRCQLISCGC